MEYISAVYLLLLSVMHTAWSNVELEHIKTVYLPLRYNPDIYEYNAGVGEQIAVNDEHPYVYTIGNNLIHVIDFTNVAESDLVYNIEVMPAGSGSLADITTCRDWVAVNVDNNTFPLDGAVKIFTRYNPANNPPMRMIADITVGSLPDSSIFTSDCSKLIVAVEGEVRNIDGVVVDPEGGAAIIDFGGDPGTATPDVTFVDFNAFDDREAEFVAKGVRKSYNGEGTSHLPHTSFSQDMEPENIALNEDETLAYITLQENNAVAILDINSRSWVDIIAFGTINYDANDNQLDPSDRDGGINIASYPIYGMYQPDGIKHFTLHGVSYLAVANEGDAREYTVEDLGMDEDWDESTRGNNLHKDGLLSAAVPPYVIGMLNDDTQLGRLQFSKYDGLDTNGKIEELHTFGGRGVAVFRVNPWSRVADTGSEFEDKTEEFYPTVFNADAAQASDTPEETMDSKSDNRGSEPEVVELGTIGDTNLMFVGLERPGMIAVYAIDSDSDDNAIELEFQSMYYGGGYGKPWADLYDERATHALDVEDLRFISADKSPGNKSLLIAAGSISGTVSFFEIVEEYDYEIDTGTSVHMSLWMLGVFVLFHISRLHISL